MDTVQLYALLNNVNKQTMGSTAIEVVDTASFVALGDSLLTSTNTVEPWLNTIVQMFFDDIVEGRGYRSDFSHLFKGDIAWGNILRKLSVDMPEITESESVQLVDGQAIDHYVVALPVVHQSLFVSRTPYVVFITIQEHWLNEAFRSEGDMMSFIGMIFTKVQNKLELAVENLTRHAFNNYAGVVFDRKPAQIMNLVSAYNAESGNSITPGMTAMFNSNFMRWSSGMIQELGFDMTKLSVLYNVDGLERFTPLANQNLIMLSKFMTQLGTTALFNAFNEQYLQYVTNYKVPYWQASGTSIADYDSKSTIEVTVATAGGSTTDITINNVVGMLFDDQALGAYRKRRATRTTPMNAAGLYTNTFWHENQMWFNALDENYILLTLN